MVARLFHLIANQISRRVRETISFYRIAGSQSDFSKTCLRRRPTFVRTPCTRLIDYIISIIRHNVVADIMHNVIE